MDKRDLAARLARASGVPKATAADQVDRVVNEILLRLRRGEPARLPGLGTLVRDTAGRIRLTPEGK
ncbi:MAG: HU family DNA-binding protein [bacterium]|jgi:nucleoid DNA-binding protein